jgi:hypothetical protein
MLGLSVSHVLLLVVIFFLLRQGRWAGLRDGAKKALKNYREAKAGKDPRTGVIDAEYRHLKPGDSSSESSENVKKS